MDYNCIIILGPTASGKTSLSINLAKLLNGEIVNADSQQIIKKLDVGTAKISEEEKENIPHHLFNIINVGDEFSVSEYRNLAMNTIRDIWNRNSFPIIVGGTGFYINSLIYDYSFGNTEKNDEIRANLEQLAKDKGNRYVYSILSELDPESASKLHENDLKRVIRAIEIFKLSGEKKSNQSLTHNKDLKPLIIGLNVERQVLYDRINKRVDLMLKNGLEDEVNKLFKSKIYDNEKLSNELPIGYSEWYDYFNNNISKEETVEKIKQDSRHYAKRQITWFKKVENVNWINIDSDSFDFNKLANEVANKIKK